MHLILDKKLNQEIQRASALTGLDAEELAHRAIILYIESLRSITDFTEEMRAWQDLGGTSLGLFESSLASSV